MNNELNDHIINNTEIQQNPQIFQNINNSRYYSNAFTDLHQYFKQPFLNQNPNYVNANVMNQIQTQQLQQPQQPQQPQQHQQHQQTQQTQQVQQVQQPQQIQQTQQPQQMIRTIPGINPESLNFYTPLQNQTFMIQNDKNFGENINFTYQDQIRPRNNYSRLVKQNVGVNHFFENNYPKPVFSYSCLIAMALKNSDSKCLPVNEIYKYMQYYLKVT